MSRVVREVRRFLDAHGVGGPGVVAVSGGADSVALLRALLEAGCGSLIVAHVNHQLRGAESDADEAFVRELAEGLGLACHLLNWDNRPAGENLEAAARRLRYDFFGAVAGETGAAWVATGHTADDQAETVLHRLIRGTGIQGLRGIAPVRANPERERGGEVVPPRSCSGFAVLRPLLTVSRADVLGYLAAINQPYREDSSNADPRFTRNRIRHELLPLLRTFNPEVVAVLWRIAEQAGEAFAVLEADAARLLVDVELPRAGDVLILDAAKLSAAHPYHVREMFRLLWHREGWPIDPMTADHWSRLVRIACGDLPSADFPGGVTVRRTARVVQIGLRPYSEK